MFLKRIELQGFKSFADKTLIRFEEGVTGIVGPNGCGKSNVNDAIRWALGEQSAKSLRSGQNMSDIIFSGSESRKAVNLARVTLVFDNSLKIFSSPFEEIEITREVRRSDGLSKCYLNKTPCRLKDISDLVMDTGLGRDSLSIITQGNISSFADARPEERRLLFEEAAGVAKYKKRKKTSLAKLDSTRENLERVADIIGELESQLEPLKKQAEKALKARELKEKLSSVEIGVLTSQCSECQQKLNALETEMKDLEAQRALALQSVTEDEEQAEALRAQLLVLDQNISGLQEQSAAALQESVALQKQKVELDEKRKYQLQQEDLQAKKESLASLLSEARFEYEDRRGRLQNLQLSLQQQTAKVQQEEQRLQALRQQENALQSSLQNLDGRRLVLENRIAAPYAHQQGIQAVLKARKSLRGIQGTVVQLLEPQPEYTQAIAQALGGASDQIVTETEADARQAIGFLKHSRAGRATFLPLSVCKPRRLHGQQQAIAANCEGILGTASDFVSCAPRYEVVRDRLLGNILVADTLENGNAAARLLHFQVKIVTLDGDVIHAGGAMTGGSQKQNSSALSLKQDLQQVKAQLEEKQQALQSLQADGRAQAERMEQAREKAMQLRIDSEKLQQIVAVKKSKYDSCQADYQAVCGQESHQETDMSDSLVAQISALHRKADAIESSLRAARDEKNALSGKSSTLDARLKTQRKQAASLSETLHAREIEKAKLETRLDQALMSLNTQYSLTYEAAVAAAGILPADELEAARQQVMVLKSELNRLGSVNEEAPEQYASVSERHQFLCAQKEELEQASAEILKTIDEMDQTMTVQFKEMFEKINSQLPDIFRSMFGGGQASLVLTDPEDLLTTGVDIDVQPPGKKVKNISTFSGGEKALIAISVLFAILKARTMPLCIFDEVEAALDQANVERFASYLSRFKDQSQFIVVTHRPGTMERCDTLYGVTMQKDGVSQLLKVQLQDAVQYTDKEGH